MAAPILGRYRVALNLNSSIVVLPKQEQSQGPALVLVSHLTRYFVLGRALSLPKAGQYFEIASVAPAEEK